MTRWRANSNGAVRANVEATELRVGAAANLEAAGRDGGSASEEPASVELGSGLEDNDIAGHISAALQGATPRGRRHNLGSGSQILASNFEETVGHLEGGRVGDFALGLEDKLAILESGDRVRGSTTCLLVLLELEWHAFRGGGWRIRRG